MTDMIDRDMSEPKRHQPSARCPTNAECGRERVKAIPGRQGPAGTEHGAESHGEPLPGDALQPVSALCSLSIGVHTQAHACCFPGGRAEAGVQDRPRGAWPRTAAA